MNNYSETLLFISVFLITLPVFLFAALIRVIIIVFKLGWRRGFDFMSFVVGHEFVKKNGKSN